MRSITVVTIATVFMALASQAFAQSCDAVSSTDSLPPANAGVARGVFNAEGVRIWDCKAGALVNSSQIDGKAEFTGKFGDKSATGGFVYVDDIARFNLTVDGVSTAFDLDNKPALTSRGPDELPDARWTVNWLGTPPAGLTANTGYLTRTESTGGKAPTECANATDKTIEVPYTTVYTLYACDGSVKADSAAPRATVTALASAVAVAAAVAVFA